MERLTNLLYLFLILVLFSCNKGAGEFSISGIVRDDTFNTSLVGSEIALYKVPLASNTEQFIGSQTITADGKYHFTVPRERIEKYILRVTKQLYF
jgi:RNase P/RNase MRP subunit p29